jgi:hypothetical protein
VHLKLRLSCVTPTAQVQISFRREHSHLYCGGRKVSSECGVDNSSGGCGSSRSFTTRTQTKYIFAGCTQVSLRARPLTPFVCAPQQKCICKYSEKKFINRYFIGVPLAALDCDFATDFHKNRLQITYMCYECFVERVQLPHHGVKSS